MRLFVRNWDRWQSYRSDRGQPPWIKIHRELLRHWEWCDLSDAEKGHLVSIWVLAADRDGELPVDERRIQQMCMLEKTPNIKRLIELGFLEERHDDASTTPSRRQNDLLEAEAEAEAEADKRANAKREKRPSREEVAEYVIEKNYRNVDPDRFFDHYESNGWRVGRNPMKSWRHAIANWERTNAERTAARQRPSGQAGIAADMHEYLKRKASKSAD